MLLYERWGWPYFLLTYLLYDICLLLVTFDAIQNVHYVLFGLRFCVQPDKIALMDKTRWFSVMKGFCIGLNRGSTVPLYFNDSKDEFKFNEPFRFWRINQTTGKTNYCNGNSVTFILDEGFIMMCIVQPRLIQNPIPAGTQDTANKVRAKSNVVNDRNKSHLLTWEITVMEWLTSMI